MCKITEKEINSIKRSSMVCWLHLTPWISLMSLTPLSPRSRVSMLGAAYYIWFTIQTVSSRQLSKSHIALSATHNAGRQDLVLDLAFSAHSGSGIDYLVTRTYIEAGYDQQTEWWDFLHLTVTRIDVIYTMLIVKHTFHCLLVYIFNTHFCLQISLLQLLWNYPN